MPDLVLTERPRPGILVIRLNRPERLNAMNSELIEALHGVLAAVRHDSTVRAVVLTGAGRAFCAGVDLHGYDDPPGAVDDLGRIQSSMLVQQHIASLVDAFRSVRAPIIAAVNGAAAGGGLALALMSDVRILADDASLHPAFIRRGFSNCDIGVSWLLPRMIGFSRAAQIMLTGRTIGTEEAEQIGLASSVEPLDRLLDAALETAETISRNSPFGVWMTKEVLWSNLESPSMRAAIDLENRTQILSAQTLDHREAVDAFLQKRTATFRNQ
ncbi:enoyl-CoA hydratase/isomerase family protein [Rhodococcus sp. NPDC019627]|uniref:enoyl-CoA hydratase/isomerase family protein n=1 Tax=unclassified Rhodococcus (in: high G+C Gram-positive bacteria) TaxID=192944 RepID=UPI0033E26719